MEKEREELGTYPFDEVDPDHTCTSGCGKDFDCPLCEHGKLKCDKCD